MTGSQSESLHAKFMRAAVDEARKGIGHTSPNPAVGAVLVAAGEIVARGFHRRAGLPHAEVECIRDLRGAMPARATLYVTLEPCSTQGRTHPCVEAIIAAGVSEVVIGAIDPNPAHAGRAIQLLRAAHVAVESGVLEEECSRLNEAFNKWIVTRHPFVIAKCGMSLDGRLTRRSGETRWLTSPAARRHARRLRARVDAILIGAETLRQDDPALTVRGIRRAKQPWRVILTRSGRLPEGARLLTDQHAQRTLVYQDQPIAAVLRDLGAKEVLSVLIEGGGEVLGQAFDAKLVDQVRFYVAPLLTGGPVIAVAGRGAGATSEAPRLREITYERIGPDICISGYPVYPVGAE